MENLEEYKLGENSDLLELTTFTENRDVAAAMAAQARRHILLFTTDLDPQVLDNELFQQAVSDLARRSRNTQVNILVHDSGPAVKAGHSLIRIAQRLSSSIHIRKTHDEYVSERTAFMVVDEYGYMRRKLAERPEGSACFADRLQARQLGRFFQEVWERSHTDPQVRRLHL